MKMTRNSWIFLSLVMVIVICCGTSVFAQDDFCSVEVPGQVFCDNFSDGSATDGMPVTWVPIGDTVLNATSGDAVVSGNVRFNDSSFSGLRIVDREFGNVSLRTQVRLSEGGWIAVSVRDGASPIEQQYTGVITVDGEIALGIVHPDGSIFPTLTPTGLNPVDNDIMLQIDAIDDKIDFWAWSPGQPMPEVPSKSLRNSLIQTGGISLNFGSTQDKTVSGVFRYVQVATQSIPEPSAAILSCLGFACLLAWQRKLSRS